MLLAYALLLIYLVTLISSCVYAFRFGGYSEKYGSVIMIAGSVLTPLFGYLGALLQSHAVGVLAVDIVVLAAFLRLALRSDKYWPLWTTAFQIIGVATHLAKFVDPAIIPWAYTVAVGFWAYPMLAAMVIGVRAGRIAAKGNAARC